MAIEFARVEYVKRSDGGNACRSAAYNARSDLRCDRTGERFYFAHRDGLLHSEVLLPEGADAKFEEIAVLWNAAQVAEKRKDSQEAKELLLALPSDPGLTLKNWQELAASFAEEHFVAKGVAVQIGIHAPHDGDVNVHAHILVTTRRLEGDRFSAAKARDLDPQIRTVRDGRSVVTEGERWGALWRDHQNRYFEAHGFDIRVDEIGIVAQRHEGPVRQRTAPDAARERAKAVADANAEAVRDPEQLLASLTHHRATFTELDIERHLRQHVPDTAERLQLLQALMAHPDLITLHEKETGNTVGRYTSVQVRGQETSVLKAASAIITERAVIAERYRRATLACRTFDAEQEAAFLKATGTDGLVIIEGTAGSGKSYSIEGIREAHERAGWRVIGLAHTNTVAEDLRRGGFQHGSTISLELFYQENERYDRSAAWNRNTCVLVDEAAMLDTKSYARLMSRAASSGAKVVLVGDDRQLSSIEHGGMFTELKQRYGSTLISRVRRQESDWQRAASENFAIGNIAEGLRAYAEANCIHWSADLEESKARLLSDWDQDSRVRPETNRFVYASTNVAVNQLNQDLRSIRLRRGEVADELTVETTRGVVSVGSGDRIQFFASDRRAGIYSGTIGTVTNIEGHRLWVTTDTGREICVDTEVFNQFGLGYAGTIYRGQGKTQTDVYAFHDSAFAWNARTAYVGLTRHRSTVNLYVARELARDEIMLGRQLSRQSHEEASLAYATAAEVINLKEVGKMVSNDDQKPPAREGALSGDDTARVKKIDLPAYASEVYGYVAVPIENRPGHFWLTGTSETDSKIRLQARRGPEGNWTYVNPEDKLDRGDILDFVKRREGGTLGDARAAIMARSSGKYQHVGDPEASRSAPNNPQGKDSSVDASESIAPKRTDARQQQHGRGATEDPSRKEAEELEEKRHTTESLKRENELKEFAKEEAARKARLNDELREAAEAEQQQLLEMLKRRPEHHQNFVDEQTQKAETARRQTGISKSTSDRGPPDGDGFPASASLRYAEALARYYDVSNPYGSLARVALAESAAQKRERWELDRKIALEMNDERRDMLLLRRDIEHADHLGQAWDRVAGQTRAVTLNPNNQDARRQEQRAVQYRQQARDARRAWEERAVYQPSLYIPLNEAMRARVEKARAAEAEAAREDEPSRRQQQRRDRAAEKARTTDKETPESMVKRPPRKQSFRDGPDFG